MTETFTEVQQFRYRWLYAVITFLAPIIVITYAGLAEEFLSGDVWVVVLLFLGYTLSTVLILGFSVFRKLSTHVDPVGIRFRVGPFGPWQQINWTDIEQAYVREFALIGEYPRGSGGFRQGPNGWVYAFWGTYGLQINKRSGGKILLGTQRPDELRSFLASLSTKPAINN